MVYWSLGVDTGGPDRAKLPLLRLLSSDYVNDSRAAFTTLPVIGVANTSRVRRQG